MLEFEQVLKGKYFRIRLSGCVEGSACDGKASRSFSGRIWRKTIELSWARRMGFLINGTLFCPSLLWIWTVYAKSGLHKFTLSSSKG